MIEQKDNAIFNTTFIILKNKIGIIVDSGASLRENKLKNIEVVPVIINEAIDKKINTYNDRVDITREEGN